MNIQTGRIKEVELISSLSFKLGSILCILIITNFETFSFMYVYDKDLFAFILIEVRSWEILAYYTTYMYVCSSIVY